MQKVQSEKYLAEEWLHSLQRQGLVQIQKQVVHGDSQGLVHNARVICIRSLDLERGDEFANMIVARILRLCRDGVDALVHKHLVAAGVVADIDLAANIVPRIVGFSETMLAFILSPDERSRVRDMRREVPQ